jgi:hypothetical protein
MGGGHQIRGVGQLAQRYRYPVAASADVLLLSPPVGRVLPYWQQLGGLAVA